MTEGEKPSEGFCPWVERRARTGLGCCRTFQLELSHDFRSSLQRESFQVLVLGSVDCSIIRWAGPHLGPRESLLCPRIHARPPALSHTWALRIPEELSPPHTSALPLSSVSGVNFESVWRRACLFCPHFTFAKTLDLFFLMILYSTASFKSPQTELKKKKMAPLNLLWNLNLFFLMNV